MRKARTGKEAEKHIEQKWESKGVGFFFQCWYNKQMKETKLGINNSS